MVDELSPKTQEYCPLSIFLCPFLTEVRLCQPPAPICTLAPVKSLDVTRIQRSSDTSKYHYFHS
jgi:hypothetical protein